MSHHFAWLLTPFITVLVFSGPQIFPIAVFAKKIA